MFDAMKILDQAAANTAKWGMQDFQTLGLAVAEEAGELAQAILQYLHEGGGRDRIREEAVDLGALCLQVMAHFSVEHGAGAPEGAPEVEDCREIARKRGKDAVIILTVDGDGRLEMATFGRNPRLCAVAKKLGDIGFDAITGFINSAPGAPSGEVRAAPGDLLRCARGGKD